MNKRTVLGVILLVLSVCLAVVSVAWFWRKIEWDYRYQVLLMSSSSMSPTINVGDICTVEKTKDPTRIYAAPKPDGDIIVFRSPRIAGELIVHRAVIKEFHNGLWYFTTQGDANYGADVWTGEGTWQNMISQNLLIGEVVGVNSSLEVFLWGSYFGIAICLVVTILSTIGGVLVIAISRIKEPPSTATKESAVVLPPIARFCPACGKSLSRLPDDMRACPYCGRNLE